MTQLVIPTVKTQDQAHGLASDLMLYGRVASAAQDLGAVMNDENAEDSAPLLKLIDEMSGVVSVWGFDEDHADAIGSMVGVMLKGADQKGDIRRHLLDMLVSYENAIGMIKAAITD